MKYFSYIYVYSLKSIICNMKYHIFERRTKTIECFYDEGHSVRLSESLLSPPGPES